GTGGTTSGGNNYGVFLLGAGSQVTSAGGAVQVTGTAGAGPGSVAVRVEAGGLIASGGNAAVTVLGDSMALLSATSVTAGTGTATLRPLSAGTAINLGSTTDSAANTLELSDAELDSVTAGTLVIGNAANTGGI